MATLSVVVSNAEDGDQLARMIIKNTGQHPAEPKVGRYEVIAFLRDVQQPMVWTIRSHMKSFGWTWLVQTALSDLKRKFGDRVRQPEVV